MKISNITAYAIEKTDHETGADSPFPIEKNSNYIFVKVDTDEGVYGLGETGFNGMGFTVVEAINHAARNIIGEDPFAHERLWQLMFRGLLFPGDRTLCSAISAIDMALWDIKGKVLDTPVYKLLGGPTRDVVYQIPHCEDPAFNGNVDQLVENAVRDYQAGFKFLRWWLWDPEPGIFDPTKAVRLMVEQVKAVRKEIGPDIPLVLDLHGRADPSTAIWLASELEPYRPVVIEDALRAENPASYRSLTRNISLPLAAGEQWAAKWEWRLAIEEELISIARIDIGLVGGITEALKIAHMAEAHYIDIAPRPPRGPISIAAANHLCFGVTNVAFGDSTHGGDGVNNNFHLPELFSLQHEFVDGRVVRSEAPGLGVELDVAMLEEWSRTMPYQPELYPILRRPDGAMNNW